MFDSGDADAILRPTERGALPMPWLDNPSALVPMWMYHEDGTPPFEGDPRHALARVLERYAARGWRVEAAAEMEFYLVDDSGEAPAPPINRFRAARCKVRQSSACANSTPSMISSPNFTRAATHGHPRPKRHFRGRSRPVRN